MKRMRSFGLFFLLTPLAAIAGCNDASSDAPEPTTTEQEAIVASPALPDSPRVEALKAAVRAHDEAKRAGTESAPAVSARSRMLDRRSQLGLDADHAFEVASVNEDDDGIKHVRLSQRFQGVRVLDTTAIVHVGKDNRAAGQEEGEVERDIRIRTQPTLTAKEAEAVVEKRPEHRRAYLIAPRTELVIKPIRERFVKATGEQVRDDAQDLNALDVERRTVDHKLAYQIDTIEEGAAEPFMSMRYLVDASAGSILSARSLSSSVAGTGKSLKSKGPANNFNVPIDTVNENLSGIPAFGPWDNFRNFGVWDDDTCKTCDANVALMVNNSWGDGKAFMGDASASLANRQTAIVDGLYGMQVTWDMFKNVFGRFGYDNKFYEGDAFVHASTDWDDAAYYSLSGNISVGDSGPGNRSSRTGIDTLAHEFGHGINDFTAELGGNAEGEGLNEASSDIIGEIVEAYERGNGQVSSLSFIPASPGPSWSNQGSGRSFINPNGPHNWTVGLASFADEHVRAMPMDHGFFFLSQGSVTDPASPQFSFDTPWGMKGVGIDKAARIWVKALLSKMTSNTDYAAARTACVNEAAELFGAGSAEHKATMNAFASINVGSPMAGYPATPTVGESEPNNSVATADPITPASPPAGAPLNGASFKRIDVVGTATSSDTFDYFSVSVPAGKTLRVTLVSTNDDDLFIYDGFDTLVDSSTKPGNTIDQVTIATQPDGFPPVFTIKVKWYKDLPLVVPMYQMFVDVL